MNDWQGKKVNYYHFSVDTRLAFWNYGAVKAKNFKQARILPEVYRRLQKTRERKEFQLFTVTYMVNQAISEWLDRIETNINTK